MIKTSRLFTAIIATATISLLSCEDDNGINIIEGDGSVTEIEVVAPETYSFDRSGMTTVSFSGQTTRILMAEEIISKMKPENMPTVQGLLDMYANDNMPFSNDDLNSSDKSVKSKTAASADYFSSNAAASAMVKADFEQFLTAQVEEINQNQNQVAVVGVAGQIADGGSVRYVNAGGFEYNQLFNKSLIGGLMLDQALNNYLGTAVLDASTNVSDNDENILADGQVYTVMEHKWDEAYGYIYGTAQDIARPNLTIGQDDNFLNKYIGRVEGDDDFAGIADEIFDAFKLGRAAIVAGNYELRDEQAALLREKLSEVIGIRAVYYLQQGKIALTSNPVNWGTGFHDISEGYGFIYSLQFTRNPETDTPYFSRAEVLDFLAQLEAGNGLWDVTETTLDTMSNTIAERFNFTVAQAAN